MTKTMEDRIYDQFVDEIIRWLPWAEAHRAGLSDVLANVRTGSRDEICSAVTAYLTPFERRSKVL